MKKVIRIASLFPKHLFWDVKWEQMDAEKDQSLIIPRALFMTNPQSFNEDIEKLELVDSSTEIINNLKVTKEQISNQVCEMVAQRYHIPVFYRYTLR